MEESEWRLELEGEAEVPEITIVSDALEGTFVDWDGESRRGQLEAKVSSFDGKSVGNTGTLFFRSVPLCCTPGHALVGSSFTRCGNTPQATHCEGVTQHNEMCHNATPRSEPASFQFKLPPSPSGRLRGMSYRTIHAMTQYRFAEDPRYLHEILDIVNRLAQEHDEVENIFSGTLTNNVLICIKCCRCFSEDSTPANKQRMRAAWLKLNIYERWVIEKIVVWQTDEMRVVLATTEALGVDLRTRTKQPAEGEKVRIQKCHVRFTGPSENLHEDGCEEAVKDGSGPRESM